MAKTSADVIGARVASAKAFVEEKLEEYQKAASDYLALVEKEVTPDIREETPDALARSMESWARHQDREPQDNLQWEEFLADEMWERFEDEEEASAASA